ncbi:Dmr6-like oxygenase [Thalictrum thalictroides]|uniref:Dmr6-like oxygenase n=1 Tax=Thalictrum thalictroides TaxID=46969 RepID=A0A7J6X748_THATH|nr:Dmr6-like oxygenase [Thalictrum thalictroides]
MVLEGLKSATGAQNLLSWGDNKLSVHPKYMISDEERQSLKQVSMLSYVPVINLQELMDDGSSRPQAIEKLRKACKEHGYFEVINHGVSEAIMEDMMKVADEFFQLPVEDKLHLFSTDYRKRTLLSTSFNATKEATMHWRDYLRHPCNPLEEHINSWPTNPSSYRDVAGKYATQLKELTLKLLEAISESLGLEKDYIAKALGKQNQTMQINYYPPCPNPDLTLALGAHTDPNCLTIVQHDEVSGLQIMKDGSWFDVPAIHGAFFVNIADQLQVISNGEYKSLVHRAVTNSRKKRISIPTFYGPSYDAEIKPADSLVAANVHGPLYVPFTFEQFLSHFYSQKLVTTTLEHFEVPQSN